MDTSKLSPEDLVEMREAAEAAVDIFPQVNINPAVLVRLIDQAMTPKVAKPEPGQWQRHGNFLYRLDPQTGCNWMTINIDPGTVEGKRTGGEHVIQVASRVQELLNQPADPQALLKDAVAVLGAVSETEGCWPGGCDFPDEVTRLFRAFHNPETEKFEWGEGPRVQTAAELRKEAAVEKATRPDPFDGCHS